MANYSSFIAADIQTTMADHPSKASQNPQALEGSIDFVQYDQPLMMPSRFRAQDEKLNGSSSVALTQLIPNAVQQEEFTQESGREKLFRHWTEVAGTVDIPEKWGQEAFLKDWMDYSLFDSFLAPKGLVTAREALVAERKRESTRPLMKTERMY